MGAAVTIILLWRDGHEHLKKGKEDEILERNFIENKYAYRKLEKRGVVLFHYRQCFS